jgi:hypothetical protein
VELTEKYPNPALIQNPAGRKFQDGREVEVLLTRWLLIQNTDFHQLGNESSSRGVLSSLVMVGNVRESRG